MTSMMFSLYSRNIAHIDQIDLSVNQVIHPRGLLGANDAEPSKAMRRLVD